MTEFKDIIGYTAEKEELKFICDIIKNSDKYINKGVAIPKTLLLYGEPGTGKTTMCKALINESGRKCFRCRKNKSNGEFVDEIRKTFEKAKKNTPSIVFLDDMDKFAEDNLQMDSNKEEFAAIQSCMEDAVDSDVFVLATANDIRYLPESLLRTGRFGRKTEIKNPDQESIKQLIEYYLKNNNAKCEIDSSSLSNVLCNTNCATIKEILNEAQVKAIYNKHKMITRAEIIPLILKNILNESRNEECKLNREQRAIHEAGHAAMGLLKNRKVSLVTIASYGESGGITRIQGLKESKNELIELEDELHIALAGKAATEMNGIDVDLGAEKDIEKAEDMTSHALRKQLAYGFNFGYNVEPFDRRQSPKRIDEYTAKTYDILDKSYKESKRILKENAWLVEVIAEDLYEKETLLYDDIKKIYENYNNASNVRDYADEERNSRKIIKIFKREELVNSNSEENSTLCE